MPGQIRSCAIRKRRASAPVPARLVPHPLREDLAKLLAAGRMGIPPIRVLLHIFISKHHFKRAAMQIQIQHIRGSKSGRGKGADKQLVDGAVPLDADFWRRGGDSMGGHHQADLEAAWRQGNGWAIVERTRHPTFRMGAHLIRGTRKSLLNHLQTKEAVVTTREAITPRPAVRTSISGAASPYSPSKRSSTEAVESACLVAESVITWIARNSSPRSSPFPGPPKVPKN